MGRYNQVKDKKSNGVMIFVAIAGLIFVGAVAWFTVGKQYLQQAADVPETKLLPLPQVAPQPEPGADNPPLLDISPVQSEPIAEVTITPNMATPENPAGQAASAPSPALNGAQLLPELDSSDALFKADMLKISPKLAPWLNTDGLIRKYLVLINDVAQETLLAKHVEFLVPKQVFAVEERDKKLFISPKSYQRYNALAAAIDDMDVAATIEVYKSIRPLLAKVFSEFSYPEVHSMEDSFTKAAAEMLVVPIIEEPIELIKPSVNYKFADPKLEALNPVHKQMLRMGPKNTRIIQNKVRLMVEALVNIKE